MSFGRLLDVLSIGLIFVIWTIVPQDVGALIAQFLANEFTKLYLDLPYSRLLESEADHIGLMIASRVCPNLNVVCSCFKIYCCGFKGLL